MCRSVIGIVFARQQPAWAAGARQSVCESGGGHKWIWSSSSASPRFTTQKHMHEIEADSLFLFRRWIEREGCIRVCVCMSIDCARMVHVVEGVVRGGVQVRTASPGRTRAARCALPLHLARVQTRFLLVLAPHKGWRWNRQSAQRYQ